MTKTIKQLIFSMLTENTGKALCDSGGDGGRNWERNQKKSFSDFEKAPSVEFELSFSGYESDGKGKLTEKEYSEIDSNEIEFSVSLFHYLPTVIEEDELCEEFNALPVLDWDGEAYGVSKRGEKWLKAHGFEYDESWNSYNGEESISQTLQGTELRYSGSIGEYVLLQIHNGADVRGGYTNAKLFKYKAFQEMINPCPEVFGYVENQKGEQVEISTMYNGTTLANEEGEPVKIKKGAKVELWLSGE